MEIREIESRILQLRELLDEYNRRYYIDNDPVVSDFEFDALMHELEALEAQYPEFDSPDSPTHHVGSDLAGKGGTGQRNFVQRPHRYPMLSLANTYSISEIEDFVGRAERALGGNTFTYSCELKFDGTAICLNYRNGRLHQALTRGDGIMGDDVTENAKRISNIPQSLHGDYPEDLEIRGEVLMPYAAFEALNAERADNDEAPFANPRNAASGSLKLLDSEEVAHRGLMCTLYHIPAESVNFASHWDALNAAASWGLPISGERRLCRNISEIRDFIAYWDVHRADLPFATDGVVLKINELDSQRSLGYTSKVPRWAVAFKFKAEQACTELRSIDYQVGRTGAVTPVANLAPVQLGGTTVKRATLNNADIMESLDVRIGDYVFVEKGGEIIPKITGVDFSRRKADSVKPEFPKTCPDCGTPLVKEEDEAKWFCPNGDGCPMQIKGRLIHFVGRKAMDILAGEARIEQLYNSGLATMPSDLYRIRTSQLLGLEGWQEKLATLFLNSVEASKSVPFGRVLFALGIRHVGETTAKTLARHFKDIDSLAAADIEQLTEVNDVGAVVAQSVYGFLHDPVQVEEIKRLKESGLQFSMDASETQMSEALSGKTIVISGNFSISRDALKTLIASHGGKTTGSVSKKTDYLVAGSKPGPEKLKQCEKFGIPVISEDELRAMLPEVSGDGKKHGDNAEPTIIQQELF